MAVNFGLSAEQSGIKALARDFADREVAPHAAEWDGAEAVRAPVPTRRI